MMDLTCKYGKKISVHFSRCTFQRNFTWTPITKMGHLSGNMDQVVHDPEGTDQTCRTIEPSTVLKAPNRRSNLKP